MAIFISLLNDINNFKIGIITFPVSSAGLVPLSNLANLLMYHVRELYLITGNSGIKISENDDRKLHVYSIDHNTNKYIHKRIINYIHAQFKLSKNILYLNHVNYWFFFLGGPSLLLPMLTAKLLRKKVILIFGGLDLASVKAENRYLAIPIALIMSINLILCNKIILYSKCLISSWKMDRYKEKIIIATRHFIDLELFKETTPINNRNNLIGYVGRFSDEKGVVNFMESIPLSIKLNEKLRFELIGAGRLLDDLEKNIKHNELIKKVEIIDWVPHNDLPKYLNEIKLIVIPSYTEGLPNLMLEAMACGTPILSTPVGAIADIIKDGETGFIMENNSPECIAENVIRALEHPDLELIAEVGRRFVEENFTFESTVARWKEVLEEI